ncbi:MAG: phosphotransferase [Pseudomonadota bacterium]
MVRLPHLPDGFTPVLLTEVLKKAGALPDGVAVTSVAHSQVGEGTGMMSEVAGLTVGYSSSNHNLPSSFIAKFASQVETNRQVALSYQLYERETRYFAELDALTSVCTPATLHSACDGERMLILMEDMRDYAVGSQVAGASLEQAELALDELARLHAPFQDKVDNLDWVPSIAGSYHADNMLALTESGFDIMVEKFGDVVTPALRERKTQFLQTIPMLQEYMARAPVTLCHGDYRMENLLYGNAPGHHPVVVLDWQGPLKARGMNDVALFLTQSATTEVRRVHERDLLARYRTGLEENGAGAPAAAQLWEDYRWVTLYNWVYVTVIAGTLDVSNAAAYAWISASLTRHSAASEDLEIFELLSP